MFILICKNSTKSYHLKMYRIIWIQKKGIQIEYLWILSCKAMDDNWCKFSKLFVEKFGHYFSRIQLNPVDRNRFS